MPPSGDTAPPHFRQLTFDAAQCRHDLDDLERLRRHVSVYGQSPLCYTFDQLARDLREVLDYGPDVPA